MKVHNDLKELLEAHTKWVLKFYTLSNGKYDDDLERAFISSNSLALGKPEPLAKNKQTERVCCHCEGKGYVSYSFSKVDCYMCKPLENPKDATSR